MNRRPSSTTIMHAMAFEGSLFAFPTKCRLDGWGYDWYGPNQMSSSAKGLFIKHSGRWLIDIGFHFSPYKGCPELTKHDWVECYGMKNGLPFVIHHLIGECPR